MSTTEWTWPSPTHQPPNFVEVFTDPLGDTHAAFGTCISTQRKVPKVHRRTSLVIGTEWVDCRRPCGQIGSLEAIEMDEPWEAYTPVYWCPDHA